jgi:4a-hydroxytetrahydrobiopterin dehydratase
MSEGLTAKKCVPCEGGVAALAEGEVCELLPQVPGWRVEGGRLRREMRFRDFVTLMAFVNRVAALAEAEGHHPDFSVHYDRLAFEVWTHAIDGLSENDFVLAAKIEALPRD